MNVWEFSPTHTFRAHTAKALDDIATLFEFRPATKAHWFGLCPLWTQLMQIKPNAEEKTKEGDGQAIYVFMGHRSPLGGDVNYLATRILIDMDRFTSASGLIGSSDPLTFCLRGKVLFYCVSETTGKLLPYPWSTFCSHWPQFFRVGDRLPYLRLMKHVHNPLLIWIRVNRGHKRSLKYICELLHHPVASATAKDVACGTLLAMVLRRMDDNRWDTIELKTIMQG